MSKKENSAPMEPLEEQEIQEQPAEAAEVCGDCLLYTSPSPRDA